MGVCVQRLVIRKRQMMKPDVQNDFSFYRRILPKMAGKRQPVVGETDAGLISMFIAQVSVGLVGLTRY